MAYSDAERAEALVALAVNRYDFKRTAEDTGVSIRSLRDWANTCPKKGVADLLERAIERMLMVIPTDWKGQDWAVAVGILMDKWLLMHGQPTSRTEGILKRIEELNDEEYSVILSEADRILAEAQQQTTSTVGSNGAGNGSRPAG